MKNYFSFLAVLISTSLFSQITIVADDFPNSGDTTMVSVADDPDVDYSSTGVAYDWDFSYLVSENQRIDTFNNVSGASLTYQLVFNNGFFDEEYQADYYANFLNFTLPSTEDLIGVSIDKPVSFTKIESDKVEMVGIGLEVSGIQVPVKWEIKDVEYELPMNFGDEWVSNSFFDMDLNPIYDGVLRRHQTRRATVDGWGNISTPFGDFEVVRTVAELDYTDSVRIVFGEFATWIEVPTPSQKIYSWWAKGQKIPVLQITTQILLGTETISRIEFKDKYREPLSIESISNSRIEVYPNPTTDFIQIDTDLELYHELIDMNGKVVLMSKENKIDVSGLPIGVYLMKSFSDQNEVLFTKKVVRQ